MRFLDLLLLTKLALAFDDGVLYRNATLLYSKEQFKEAKAELEMILKHDPKNKDAITLQKHILEMEKLPAGPGRKQKMAEFITDFALKDLDGLEKQMRNFQDEARQMTFPEETDVQKERRLASLEEKYKVSEELGKISEESWEELQLSNAYLSYRETQNWKRAEEVLEERLSKFPSSSSAHRDFTLFLIERNRPDEAKSLAKKGLKKFPTHPELRLLSDSLHSLEKAKTDIEKLKTIHELNQSLLQIANLKLSKSLK